MSILKIMSELKILKKQIESLDFESHNNSDASILTSYADKFNSLKKKADNFEASPDIISSRIEDIYNGWSESKSNSSTPTSSPEKNPPKKAFGSPSKLVRQEDKLVLSGASLNKAGVDSTVGQELQELEYGKRKDALHQKTIKLLEKLDGVINLKKEKIITEIMKSQSPENSEEIRLTVKKLMDEFFQLILEEKGVFERVAMQLQKTCQKKRKHKEKDETAIEVRRDFIAQAFNSTENDLFKSLGQVSSSPEYFFDSNDTAKTLSDYFMKNLYEDPTRKAVISSFQNQKRQGLRLVSLNNILNIFDEAQKELRYDFESLKSALFYIENEGAREYITAPLSEQSDLTLIKLNSDKVADFFEVLKKSKGPKYANAKQQEIYRIFEESPPVENIEGCISFFPLKTIEANEVETYTCLVTTSGEVSKINGEKSKAELVKLQSMLKTFSKNLAPGKGYTFVYHGKEQPGMDFVLDKINKALSGKKELSVSQDRVDPNRGCAEKKFIAYLRELILENKKVEVLGSANRRIPLVNGDPSLKATMPQEEKMEVNAKLDVSFYQRLLDEVEHNGLTTEGKKNIIMLLTEGLVVEKFDNDILDKVGKIYNQDKLPVQKQVKPLIDSLQKKMRTFSSDSATAPTKTKKNRADASGLKAETSNFIPCCPSCQENKIATLTLLESWASVLLKQSSAATIHTGQNSALMFSTPPGRCRENKEGKTSMTPDMAVFHLGDALNNPEGRNAQGRSLFSKPG